MRVHINMGLTLISFTQAIGMLNVVHSSIEEEEEVSYIDSPQHEHGVGMQDFVWSRDGQNAIMSVSSVEAE